MSPADRLAEARRIVDEDLLGSASSRASVFLVRRALEDAILRHVGPEVAAEGVPFRVVLLALRRRHADRQLAARAAAAWNGLSRACHAYGYELPPPEGTVRSWISEVEQLTESLAGQRP